MAVVRWISVLAVLLSPTLVASQALRVVHALNHRHLHEDAIARRQNGLLSSLSSCAGPCPIIPSTSAPPTTSTRRTSTSTLTVTPSARTTIVTTTSTESPSITPPMTTRTRTQTGYDLAMTTTFTQPTACSKLQGGFTKVYGDENLYYQLIDPMVSSAAYESCFPSQFYSSVLATISLSYFDPLICPYNWGPNAINSTYIICCPPGFEMAGYYLDPDHYYLERPGLDAECWSIMGGDELVDVTSYDSTGGTTFIPSTLNSNGTIVLAYGFDGIPATPVTTGWTFNITPLSLVTPSTQAHGPNLKSATSAVTSSSATLASATSTSPASSTSKSAASIYRVPLTGLGFSLLSSLAVALLPL